MSLINCPECGHEMSTEADNCPKCGRPIFGIENPQTIVFVTEPSDTSSNSTGKQIVLGLLFGIILISLIYIFFIAPKEATQPQNANVYVVVPN